MNRRDLVAEVERLRRELVALRRDPWVPTSERVPVSDFYIAHVEGYEPVAMWFTGKVWRWQRFDEEVAPTPDYWLDESLCPWRKP